MSMAIISDLHIGSPHCYRDGLLSFLASLAEDDVLVLNGDVRDRFSRRLGDDDQAVLSAIEQEADRRRVIWLEGNHLLMFTRKDDTP